METAQNMPGKEIPFYISDRKNGVRPTILFGGRRFFKRLNGVEPSHMPPEGIALSTELQTHSGLFKNTSS